MTRIKLYQVSLFALLCFAFYTLAVVAAYAQSTIPSGTVTGAKSEITEPEIVEETPQSFEIEISPNVIINVPNTDHVPYFLAKVHVKASGIASVTENFYIVVTENNTKVPFYREYPKYVSTPVGLQGTNVEILKTTHNLAYSPFEVESTLDANKIYFGDSKNGLSSGVHNFTVQYQIPNAMRSVGKDKVFALSLAGKGWNVPITRTVAILRHPTLVTPKGQTVFIDNIPDDKIKIYTNPNDTYSLFKGDILNPFQNLVLLETFPADSLGGLSFLTRFKHFIDMNMTTLIYFLGLVFVFVYYFITWFTVEKEERKILNPATGSNNTRFFSPAAFRIFLKKTMDSRAIATLLISLATKGMIKIEEKESGKFTLIRQINTDKKIFIPEGEKRLLNLLFPKGTSHVELDDEMGKKFTRHRKNVELPLRREYDKQYLKMNISYFLFGILVLLATLIVGAVASKNMLWVGITSVVMTGAILLAVSTFTVIASLIKSPAYKESKLKLAMLINGFLIASAVSLGCVYVMVLNINIFAAVFLALMLLCIFSAYQLLKTDKKLGRAMMASSKFYEAYLSQNPVPFLNLTANLQKAQQLFATHLPYAAALGYEDKWNARFFGVLNAKEDYILPWYAGEEKFSADFTKNLIDRLTKAMEEHFTFLNPKIQRFR